MEKNQPDKKINSRKKLASSMHSFQVIAASETINLKEVQNT